MWLLLPLSVAMSAALLLFANTPYQGATWTTSQWLDAAAFPKRLTDLVVNWGGPASEVALHAGTRGRGQGYQGTTLRARIVQVQRDADQQLTTPVLIFRHGDPMPAQGATATPLLPRRSFLVPVGVPAVHQVLEAYSVVLQGDLGHQRELSPTLLWEVASKCWLPRSPDVVHLLLNAVLSTFKDLARTARAASRAWCAGRKDKGRGKHAGVDRFYPLSVKYQALHSVLDEGWCLYQQSLDEARAAEADVPEVTRWTPGPRSSGWRNVHPLDVCAAPDPQARHFTSWFELACEPTSGFQTLNYCSPETSAQPAALEQFLATWRHDLKCTSLASLLQGNDVVPATTLRAWVPPDTLDEAWVVGTASHAETASPRQPDSTEAPCAGTVPSTGPELGTFKDHACLVVPLAAARHPGVTLEQLWRRSWLRLLSSAPQSTYGRWRLRFFRGLPVSGDVIIVILGYLGWAIDAYAALSRGVSQLGGLMGSAVRMWYGAQAPGPGNVRLLPAKNFLHGKLTESRLRALETSGMRRLSRQQEEVFLRIGASQCPVHLVTAIAGAGKSTLVQAMLGEWEDEEGLILWLTSSRELRDDVLLNSLLLPGAALLSQEQVMWAGRPVSAAAGDNVLDNDVIESRIRDQMQPVFDTCAEKRKLITQKVQEMQAQPGPPRYERKQGWAHPCPQGVKVPKGLALVLETAAETMRLAWRACVLDYHKHQEAMLAKVKVLVCTAALATRLLANRRKGHAKALLRLRPVQAAVVDEVQNETAFEATALAAQVPCLIFLGDALQDLTHLYGPRASPTKAPCAGDTDPLQPHDAGAEQVFRKLTGYCGGVNPISAMTPLRHTAEVHTLSECWRFGRPLTDWIAAMYRVEIQEFKPADPAKRTAIRIILYETNTEPGSRWWSRAECLQNTRRQEQAQADTNYWDSVVCWHEHLFHSLAVEIMADVLAWSATGKECAPHEPIVLVMFYLKRAQVLFEAFFRQVFTSWAVSAGTAGVPEWSEQVKLTNIHIRLAAAVTGPTAWRTHIIHHRRLAEQLDQLEGVQGDSRLRYVCYTRCVDMIRVWWEADPCQPLEPLLQADKRGDVQVHSFLTAALDDKDQHQLFTSLVVHAAEGSGAGASRGGKRARFDSVALGRLRHEFESLRTALGGSDAPRAEKLDKFAGCSLKVSGRWDHVFGPLSQHPAMQRQLPAILQSAGDAWRDAQCQAGIAELKPATQNLEAALAALPDEAITQVSHEDLREAAVNTQRYQLRPSCGAADDLRTQSCSDFSDWRHVATSWAAAMVNCLTVSITGRATATIAVPWLTCTDAVPQPDYSAKDDGDPVLHCIVRAVWEVLEICQRDVWHEPPQPLELFMHSRHHKGKVRLRESMSLWVKACAADREAVTLVQVKDASKEPQVEAARQAAATPGPERLKLDRAGYLSNLGNPLLYLYYGAGVSEQPEEVGGLVVRSRSLDVTIATVVAMQLLNLAACPEQPVNTRDPELYTVTFTPAAGVCLVRGLLVAAVRSTLVAMGVHDKATRWTPAQAARRVLNEGCLPTDQEWTWWAGQAHLMRLALEECMQLKPAEAPGDAAWRQRMLDLIDRVTAGPRGSQQVHPDTTPAAAPEEDMYATTYM